MKMNIGIGLFVPLANEEEVGSKMAFKYTHHSYTLSDSSGSGGQTIVWVGILCNNIMYSYVVMTTNRLEPLVLAGNFISTPPTNNNYHTVIPSAVDLPPPSQVSTLLLVNLRKQSNKG